MFIDREKLQEMEPHKFVVDASEIRFAPGHWPRELHTSLGNGQVMVPREINKDGNEIQSIVYRQLAGCVTIKVYND